MERKIFLEHYRICTTTGGSPNEISRSGPAMTYKAVDTRSKETVALQLLPLNGVDPAIGEQVEERAKAAQKLDHVNIARLLAVGMERDSVVLVSEYLQGDTVDSWLAAHGPMPADAVLRVGLQVVRALAAAAFHGMTHGAIEPSNILIAPGQTADGGWPFVKVLHFGLAGLQLHSGRDASELSTAPAPQFASPEQLLNKPLDFRSEIYSLGATMCFLLTGAVPLAVGGMKARLRARRLPELRRAPRALRNLLVHMLRENPENRPQDPVAFELEMRECLTKVERRQAIGRKLGLPLAAVIPRSTSTSTKTPLSPQRQIWLGALAVVGLIMTAALVAAFLLPEDVVSRWRNHGGQTIGTPVGVPETAPSPIVYASPLAAPSPTQVTDGSPVAASNENRSAAAASEQASNPAATPATTAPPPNMVAKNESEPPPPAQGPDEQQPATPANSADVEANTTTKQTDVEPSPAVVSRDDESGSTSTERSDSSSALRSKKKTTVSASRRSSTTSRRTRIREIGPNESHSDAPQSRSGYMRAEVVGFAQDGRVILRLPSGRIVYARPRPAADDQAPVMRHRRVTKEPEGPVPYQPFEHADRDQD
jgi:serine/threonine protein kinase